MGKIWLAALAVFLCVCSLASTASAQQQDDESLDRELLEGLERDLREPEKSPVPSGREKGAQTSPEGDLNQRRKNPLMPIGETMQLVEKLLQGKESLRLAVETQEQVVKDLQQLLGQIEQQKGQGSASSSGGGRQKPSQGKGKNAADPDAASTPDGPPEDDKSSASEQADAKGRMREIMKSLWGHLPQREREQMLQDSAEQFLPKYEVMIEKYFRKFAERTEEGKP